MPLEDSWDLLKVHKLSNKAIVIGAVSRESDEKQWKEKKRNIYRWNGEKERKLTINWIKMGERREKKKHEAFWIGDCQPEMVNKHHVCLVNNIFFYRLFKVGGGFKIWTFSLETPNNAIELQDEGI